MLTPFTQFLWEFTDKDGKYRAINVPSPVTFVHNEITYDVANTVALNHDPRESSRLNAVYETDRGAGLVGAVNTKYLNIDMPLMKKIAIELIKVRAIPDKSGKVIVLTLFLLRRTTIRFGSVSRIAQVLPCCH